jgi:hypothetical protein
MTWPLAVIVLGVAAESLSDDADGRVVVPVGRMGTKALAEVVLPVALVLLVLGPMQVDVPQVDPRPQHPPPKEAAQDVESELHVCAVAADMMVVVVVVVVDVLMPTKKSRLGMLDE